MGDGVDIDLYANLDEEFTQPEAEFTSHGDDLYDDVITAPSSSDPAEIHNKGDSSSTTTSLPTPSGFTGKKYMLYVGNLTWWTTDEDLSDAIVSIGVSDLLEVKFYENRANGQSKGFALVTIGSEASSRLIFEKLARKEFYGQAPQITPYSKQALSNFEAQARKGAGGAAATEDRRNSADSTPNTMFYDKNARMPRPGLPAARPQFNPRMARPPTMVAGPPHTGPPLAGPPANFVNGTRPPFTPTGPPPGMPPHHVPPPRAGPPPRMVNIFRPPNMMGMPPNRGPPQGPPRGPPPFGQRGPPPRPEWERPPGAPFHHRGPPPTAVPPPGVRPHVPMGAVPGMPPGLPPPVSAAPHMGVPPPAPHVNPAFFPPPHNAAPPPGAIPPPIPNAADPYGRPPPTVYPDPYGRPPPSERERERDRERSREREREREPPAPALTEQEFEEIFQRNKTVSSSAINRAVSDASAGEFASAIETLVTAISLIKQSKIASDDRCKILISSLQDTLHGIEEKSYGSKSQPRRSRSRDRDRDRDRKERGRSHRSRSREREYRERSRDRERERYHEDRHRERDRDRDREREREREYRRH